MSLITVIKLETRSEKNNFNDTHTHTQPFYFNESCIISYLQTPKPMDKLRYNTKK